VKRYLSLWLALLSVSCALAAQTAAPKAPAASTAQSPAPPAVLAEPTQTDFTSKKGFVLEDQTPVRLRLNRTISSADAHVGDTVDFEALDDITVNGTLVIPKGGLAFATITAAQAKRRMARGGKLDMNIDYVKLVSGDRAALREVKDGNGGGHTGAMVGGMVATAIVFFPAAPFFLFMHGKDISIPKGTEITAYVNGDVKMDLAKFQPAPPANAPAEGAAAADTGESAGPVSAKLHVESDPAGAGHRTRRQLHRQYPLRCSGHRRRSHRDREEGGIQQLGAESESYGREQREPHCTTGESGDSVASLHSSATLVIEYL